MSFQTRKTFIHLQKNKLFIRDIDVWTFSTVEILGSSIANATWYDIFHLINTKFQVSESVQMWFESLMILAALLLQRLR